MFKSIANFLKKAFSKKQEPVKVPSPKPIEVKRPSTIPSNEMSDIRIALIRGHGGKDSGASGNGTNEVEYNTFVINYILKNSKRNVKGFFGDSSMDAVNKSLSWEPVVSIQFHVNDADSLDANGFEALVIFGDKKSYELAEKLAEAYRIRFGRKIRRDKGKKILDSGDRGAASVRKSKGVKLLIEPFFIRNKNDFVTKEEYAQFMTDCIDTIEI